MAESGMSPDSIPKDWLHDSETRHLTLLCTRIRSQLLYLAKVADLARPVRREIDGDNERTGESAANAQ